MSQSDPTNTNPSSESLIEESHHLRSRVGLIDLSNRDRLCLLGEDRHRFLNGQVTNNIRDLRPGNGCYTLCTNNKGIIQSDAQVYALEDELLLDLEPGQGPDIQRRLESFIISDDVEIVDVAPHFGLLTVQGPLAQQVVKSAEQLGLEALPASSHQITKHSTQTYGEIYVASNPRIGTSGYDLFVGNESFEAVADLLKHRVEEAGGAVCHANSLDPLRIEAGIPRFPMDMEPSILAPELGIESQTISYSKGCYIGQEVINRIKSVGKVNRRLVGLRYESEAPSAGTPLLHDGKRVGVCLSSAYSNLAKGMIGLALVKTTHADPSTELASQASDHSESQNAHVSQLPFRLD